MREDDLRIELDRERVASGETLRGRAVLRLEESVAAQRLTATLSARQRIHRPRSSSPSTDHVLCLETVELAGEAQYYDGEYPFEIEVPRVESLANRPLPGPALLHKILAWIVPYSIDPIRWELALSLEGRGPDLERRFDLEIDAGEERAERRAS